MGASLQRAHEVLRELESGYTILDARLSEEICSLLESLLQTVEAQSAKLNAAEFALNYYREPHLYVDDQPRSPTEPILDGGLRARTALGVIANPNRYPLPVRIPLPDRE